MPRLGFSALNPKYMGEDASSQAADGRNRYECAGALTIVRAASTQREIDALADPIAIDVSKVDRIDTVGAWILYRTLRDLAPTEQAVALVGAKARMIAESLLTGIVVHRDRDPDLVRRMELPHV